MGTRLRSMSSGVSGFGLSGAIANPQRSRIARATTRSASRSSLDNSGWDARAATAAAKSSPRMIMAWALVHVKRQQGTMAPLGFVMR